MKSSISAASVARHGLTALALVVSGLAATLSTAQARTALADQPVFTSQVVPGNVAFPLSVEWPTVQRAAYPGTTDYSSSNNYLGYFDPAKCYTYSPVATETALVINHFYPVSLAAVDTNGATLRTCGGTAWSGNFLNWAATPTIDPFRWAMTGGYRVIDEPDTTILEKAWSSSQGSLFPDKTVTGATLLAGATPTGLSSLKIRVDHLGNKMRFTKDGALGTVGVNYTSPAVSATVYEVFVRVKVCDPTVGVESNCAQYGSNWKPEGLIQKYSNKMRYSVFGYLNDSNQLRDGGVLRARQKFVGPTQPVPGSTAVTNSAAEWSSTTGQFIRDPDAAEAAATNLAFTPTTAVADSGVINYMNKFGEIRRGDYKSKDPVSELYYATLRYLKGLTNVSSYTDMSTAVDGNERERWVDGFPVITNWRAADPIQYSCQRNFILGIGDIYTHRDKNLPGSTSTVDEPTMPTEVVPVTGDPTYTAAINAITATNKVFAAEGLSTPNWDSYSGRNNSAGMVGLAYDANTRDIRSDMPGMQTVQTYWVDVLEAAFVSNNQYYLAAKWGGFKVPKQTPAWNPYPTGNVTLDEAWWHTSIGSPDTNLVGTQKRPDNYFTGGRPDQLVAGLNAAFVDIAKQVEAFTTSFSTSLPQVALAGNSSFSSKYDAGNWTGEITASNLSFDATTGDPTLETMWSFTDKLAAQLSGTGWDTARRVATWNGSAGVAFRATSVLNTDLALLDTSYVPADDRSNYLDYLRGDQSKEIVPNVTDATKVYRARTKLLGDIVGSKARPVGAPSFPYSDATNPGYAAFKATWASRRTVVYVGSNDGMMHAVNGALVTTPTVQPPAPAPAIPVLESDPDAGKEMFAYVPRALFKGPSATPTPNINGLAALGNPTFAHRYLVNATPNVYDIDFVRVPGATLPTPPAPQFEWHSVLIGGLGKGGRSYYALDVTNPVAMAGSETTVASKVLWEFSDPALGYTFGDPVVAKTRKYGWVVIFPSGYNNDDGQGYFLIVNPKTGALLEKRSTGAGSLTSDAGLAHTNAFIVDASDGTADSIYAGDLLGNLWRLDLTAATGAYPDPVNVAVLTDALGATQPVTSRPSIEVHPSTKKRFVMVGTGRLLDESDITSIQQQNFYAIVDGTNAVFTATPALPLAFPYTRSVLANNANALVGVTFNPATQAGWYEDLGVDTGTAIAWRITTDSSTLSGSVAFVATLPNGSVCAPSGSSRVYARDYAAAVTTVRDTDQNAVLYVPQAGSVTDLRYLSVRGKAELISGTDIGDVSQVNINPVIGLQLRRLNWRELQVVD